MALFEAAGREIYYEVHGTGRPLLLLNGIFMTTASWGAFVPAYSQRNQLILLDFLDQGRSAKLEQQYDQAVQVEVVRALLQQLDLPAVSLAGISYGGEVAMQFALRYPELVQKLVLANTTAYTNPWLSDMGKAWEYAIGSYDGRQFFKTCIPVVYSPEFYSQNIDWARRRERLFQDLLSRDVYDGFLRLVRSAEGLDLRAELGRIQAPTLVLSAEHDYVTPLPEQEQIVRAIPGAAHLLIKGCGHAAMYEKPVEFSSAVLGFVNTDIDIKIG